MGNDRRMHSPDATMKRRRPEGGFTLVEIAIVAALMGVLMLGIMVLTGTTQDAYHTVQQDTDANFSLRQALNRMSDDLRQSSSSIIVITEGSDHDSIDLQVPISKDGSTVNWGAAGAVGLHIRIFVEDGWLIRRVVDAGGTPMRTDEVLARNVDDLYLGEKGFRVTESDGLYTITVRVTASRQQHTWRRTETTSISTRN